jgi:15-cis-phytoene desaturase
MIAAPTPTRPRVAVFGGGMGGLACAHELARQGVSVQLYEGSNFLGGKARSQFIPGTGFGGRRDLPGEHGFRFYPGFYRHVIASMLEIPDQLSPTGTVAGNLVGTSEGGVAAPGMGVIATPRRPRSLRDAARALSGIQRVGGSVSDLARYLAAHLKYLTSCDGRRDHEIEWQSWARFIGADRPGTYGDDFRKVLLACTRTMVAMDATRGSGRTVGQASTLLLLDSFGASAVDRTMMGPTTDCWIEPWRKQLAEWGVEFQRQHRITRVELSGGEVARVWVQAAGRERPIQADAFVLALPLEVTHRLITPELASADLALARLGRMELGTATDWMVGAQFFLTEDVPLCEGHLFFPSSPWSLTAISQAQFWNRGRRGMNRYGPGFLRGILSVDVSSCFAPDGDGVRLVDGRSREEILRRILRQILVALDDATARRLERAVFAMHLDTEVQVGPRGVTNAGRLLVHPPGSRHQRPEATLTVPNLFLAADFVRTSMDLASMEGANEAGRRAARGVLRHLGLDETPVRLFSFEGLERFSLLRRLDRQLLALGLPHVGDMAARLVGSGPPTP